MKQPLERCAEKRESRYFNAGRSIGMKERCILEAHPGKKSRGGYAVKDLPYCIEISIGI